MGPGVRRRGYRIKAEGSGEAGEGRVTRVAQAELDSIPAPLGGGGHSVQRERPIASVEG